MTHELPAQGKAVVAFSWKSFFHAKQPGLSTTSLGCTPGSQQGWESFTCPRGDISHALGVGITPGPVCLVGQEVPDLLCIPTRVTLGAPSSA